MLTGLIIYQIIAGLIMCGFFLENADADTPIKTIVTWLFINLVIGFVTVLNFIEIHSWTLTSHWVNCKPSSCVITLSSLFTLAFNSNLISSTNKVCCFVR